MPTSRLAVLVATLAAALLVLVAGCFDVPKPEPKPITVAAVVLDLSMSMIDEHPCSQLPARVRRVLGQPGVRRLDVVALGTGDAQTGLEPIILVPWTRYEPTAELYEEPGHAEATRDAWLDGLRVRCEENVRPTRASPIFDAIRRGAESVRARCVEIDSRKERCDRRLLYVHSDLRENGDKAIYDHLRALTRRQRAPQAPLPRLDAPGIDLSVCGVSATQLGSGEDYVAPEVLARVWNQVFGPGTPPFDAACPVDAPAAAPTGSEVPR